jgi:hypothetical protein
MNNSEKTEKPIRGKRNLVILAIGTAIIAVSSTAASLQLYRSSGDIYLDRSRPGYISENEKHNEEDDQKEMFSSEGDIDEDTLEGYLKEYDDIVKRIDDASDDFSLDSISDETFGISVDSGEFRDDL